MKEASPQARGKPGRVRTLKEGKAGAGPVLYWMSRDQRGKDNWALLCAQETAIRLGRPLVVAFSLVPAFLGAARRQYDFMLRGLAEVAESLARKNIPFLLLEGDPGEEVPRFAAKIDAAEIVTDFDPLRIKRAWKKAAARRTDAPIREVDAHNVIPAWVASDKQEYAARTFRPKVRRLLPQYLGDIPVLKKHPRTWRGKAAAPDWRRLRRKLPGPDHPLPVTAPDPGERAAAAALRAFVKKKLDTYDRDRNDPVRKGSSGLSPYLHFGQLSAQRVALAVSSSGADPSSQEAFLEELIVRRELADNFCLYQEQYDSVEGFPDWSRRTLKAHGRDPSRRHRATIRSGTPPRPGWCVRERCTAT
jgi:deoxyribodipyrimidine photo-lyase